MRVANTYMHLILNTKVAGKLVKQTGGRKTHHIIDPPFYAILHEAPNVVALLIFDEKS